MMSRFKAEGGIPSPQQPREQQGRLTALTSRAHNFSHEFPQRLRQRWNQPNKFEQQLSQKLAEAAESSTEKFRTNNEALLRESARELTDVIFRVPENRLRANADDPLYFMSSTGNGFKGRELSRLLQPHPVILRSVPDAEEEHSLQTIRDAQSKTISAEEYIQTNPKYADLKAELEGKPYVIGANDVLNAVPVVAPHKKTKLNEITYQRLGKPETLQHPDGSPLSLGEQLASIRNTFQGMAENAQRMNVSVFPYLAEIATIIHNPKDPTHDGLSTQKTLIFLSSEKLAALANPEKPDFAEYLYKVGKEFDITKIAGGLEFKVLQEMGAVAYITGSPEDIHTHQRLLQLPPSDGAIFPPQRQDAERHASRIVMGQADERLIAAYFGSTNEPNVGVNEN